MKELLTAIKDIQKNIIIYKDRKGYGYNYASIEQILFSLFNNEFYKGLCSYSYVDNDSLHTILEHVETGQKIISKMKLPSEKIGIKKQTTKKVNNDIVEKTEFDMKYYQNVGAGLTYYRRYQLMLILGLAPTEDNDGAIEQQRKEKPINNAQKKVDVDKLINKIKEATNLDKLEEYFFINQELLQNEKVKEAYNKKIAELKNDKRILSQNMAI